MQMKKINVYLFLFIVQFFSFPFVILPKKSAYDRGKTGNKRGDTGGKVGEEALIGGLGWEGGGERERKDKRLLEEKREV